jgi:hypothetical protein
MVQGFRFSVSLKGPGFRVQGLKFGAWDLRFMLFG